MTSPKNKKNFHKGLDKASPLWYSIIRKRENLQKKGKNKVFTSMIIIMAWEITADVKGVLYVPEWLDNAYEKVTGFWENLIF